MLAHGDHGFPLATAWGASCLCKYGAPFKQTVVALGAEGTSVLKPSKGACSSMMIHLGLLPLQLRPLTNVCSKNKHRHR